jgi:oligoribonuclease
MTVALENTPEVLPRSELNLVWIDCEMTGLDPEAERLIEIAVIVTGPEPDASHRRPGTGDSPER